MSDIARTSAVTRWRARRLSEHARAALDRAPVADDTFDVLRTSISGIDPVRVLLFGSGPLTGYGVRQRKDAVDGHLGRLLTDATGRGTSVESRVRLSLPTAQAVQSLGGAGTVTFHVAVWAPRFGEELQHGDAGRTRSTVHAMLQEFRARSPIPLVVCPLPTPLGLDWRTVLRRPRVARFNHLLAEEASRVPDVVVAEPVAYRPAEAGAIGTDWHRQLAELLAPAVLGVLAAPGVRSPR